MKTQILIFFLLVGTFLSAQVLNVPFTQSQGLSSIDLMGTLKEGRNTKKVEGSAYLYKSWKGKSTVYFQDKIYDFTSLNYNVYAERFEAKVSEDSVYIINSGRVDKVLFHDRIFQRYLDPEFQRNSYFEELVNISDFRILRKYYAKIKDAEINPMTKVAMGLPTLIQNENFYLLRVDNVELEKIKLKKSFIFDLMSKEYIKDVQTFVKENRLKYSDPEDIKDIFLFYNNLKV